MFYTPDCRTRSRPRRGFADGAHDHRHVAPIEPWHLLYHARLLEVRRNPVHNSLGDILVRNLASPEHHRHFGFVPFVQKLADALDFEFVVMRLDLRPELDLFDRRNSLVLAGFGTLFLLLILELAVVHDAAHGRSRLRRNLHEVEAGLDGLGKRQLRRHDAQLVSVGADDPDFACPNASIDPQLWFRFFRDVVLLFPFSLALF